MPTSCRALSVPSFFAPTFIFSTLGGRLPTQRKLSSRERKSFTGRPVCRDSSAAASVYLPGSSLLPKPPPM